MANILTTFSIIPNGWDIPSAEWEGDTLVVDTIGMRPETWLDTAGLEHSDKLHVTEKFQKTGPDTLKWTVTIEDPVFFTHPFTYERTPRRMERM